LPKIEDNEARLIFITPAVLADFGYSLHYSGTSLRYLVAAAVSSMIAVIWSGIGQGFETSCNSSEVVGKERIEICVSIYFIHGR
jgi:hypothetical protein